MKKITIKLTNGEYRKIKVEAEQRNLDIYWYAKRAILTYASMSDLLTER